MHQDLRSWTDRYFETLNTRPKTREVLSEFVRDDFLLEYIQVYERAFPHYQLTVEDVLIDGDRVAVRFRLHGTQLGEFYGIPPTGNTVSVPAIIIYRLQDEHIAEHWMEADVPLMMAQLTTLPESTPA